MVPLSSFAHFSRFKSTVGLDGGVRNLSMTRFVQAGQYNIERVSKGSKITFFGLKRDFSAFFSLFQNFIFQHMTPLKWPYYELLKMDPIERIG